MNRLEIATRLSNAYATFLDGIKLHPGSTAEAEAVELDEAVMFALAELRSAPPSAIPDALPGYHYELVKNSDVQPVATVAERKA